MRHYSYRLYYRELGTDFIKLFRDQLVFIPPNQRLCYSWIITSQKRHVFCARYVNAVAARVSNFGFLNSLLSTVLNRMKKV